jgi:drug/metabolite transporter superfamily protein YnfA
MVRAALALFSGGQYVNRRLIIQRTATVQKAIVLSLLLVATTLEAGGDAVVRAGLHQSAKGTRMLLLLAGGIMLFCYGVVLNQAPFDFGRLIGAYVATFFVVGQVINLVAFGTPPSLPVAVGDLLIIIGGAVITLWDRPA